MKLPTEALELHRLAAKAPGGEEPDEQQLKLSHVRIEPEGTMVVTDGHVLVMTKLPDAATMGDGQQLKEAQSVPRAVADLAVKLSKAVGVKELELHQEEDGPTFYGAREEQEEGLVLRFHSDHPEYPDWLEPAKQPMRAKRNVVVFDPARLRDLIDVACKQGAKEVFMLVDRPVDPVEVRWNGKAGLVSTALLMPVKATEGEEQEMPMRVVPCPAA